MRIAIDARYVTDHFPGIGRYVYNTHMSHLAHKHASLLPLIVPQYQAATRTYGVTLMFSPGGWSGASRE